MDGNLCNGVLCTASFIRRSSSSNSSCSLLFATILELEIRDQSYLNSFVPSTR